MVIRGRQKMVHLADDFRALCVPIQVAAVLFGVFGIEIFIMGPLSLVDLVRDSLSLDLVDHPDEGLILGIRKVLISVVMMKFVRDV
jgi:hypothetical protein